MKLIEPFKTIEDQEAFIVKLITDRAAETFQQAPKEVIRSLIKISAATNGALMWIDKNQQDISAILDFFGAYEEIDVEKLMPILLNSITKWIESYVASE